MYSYYSPVRHSRLHQAWGKTCLICPENILKTDQMSHSMCTLNEDAPKHWHLHLFYFCETYSMCNKCPCYNLKHAFFLKNRKKKSGSGIGGSGRSSSTRSNRWKIQFHPAPPLCPPCSPVLSQPSPSHLLGCSCPQWSRHHLPRSQEADNEGSFHVPLAWQIAHPDLKARPITIITK